ncbi:3'(2')- 5'-bisphosphate nucleotidase [Penicillium canescens]|uniref:3'(2')- 5'-bisphosphate nucleotidase n=1 Tax=Penicillium canescens TaxID=5083 RepID=A0AAD6IKQ7_PENCN|nr:3'(2')- 5'-bisphosphate nucleotidase [Penicillium canescens]KAJ6049649.1 3'(2')- 5'-bisphosphate nucleotidase [Penicillium canescens]KAJ6052382.1 3'(2')- 5'-bisphosphate nucleotidase [Penicillium canescens]KAJ6062904.1 3'(2')- 5'-bisphosphate nucleotidase [Penicillium canescens]
MKYPYAREHHIAELAVLRASILTNRVQSTVSVISKYDDSPVTIADFGAQALLIKALHDAFPDDKFLGEEDSAVLRAEVALRNKVYDLVSSTVGVSDPQAYGALLPKLRSVEEMLDLIDLGGRGTGGDKGRFWVMDPVDGTAAFLKGQQYAVSLALIEDGREVVGVLGCPNISAKMTRLSEENVEKNGLGIMLSATRGQGSSIRKMTLYGLEDAIPLHDLAPSSSEKLHIIDCAAATDCRHDVVACLANVFGTIYPNTEIWSSHIRYAALIIGGGDVQFFVPTSPACQIHIWDHTGAQLIFTELGGKVTDLDGKTMDFGAGRDLSRNKGLIAARGEIHKTVLDTMKKILEERREGKAQLV